MPRRTDSLRRFVRELPGRRLLLRLVLLAAVGWFLVRPLVPRVAEAARDLDRVDARLAVAGFVLQVASLFCYSAMTRVALGDERCRIGIGRLFRIQLVSRAVSSTVPGGAAAGPTVGYRLLTASGVSSRASGAALASGSALSALVLNVGLWVALLLSVPLYGFNAPYVGAALIGIVVMLAVAGVLLAVIDESAIVERSVRVVSGRFGFDAEAAMNSIRSFGRQLEDLLNDGRLVSRLSGWAAANWLLDAVSLWVFLQAFGVSVGPVGLIVAFGIANVLAAIPVSPGGVGIVEWAYISVFVALGAAVGPVTLAVTSYRLAQFLFPVLLGGLASASFGVETWLLRRRARPAL